MPSFRKHVCWWFKLARSQSRVQREWTCAVSSNGDGSMFLVIDLCLMNLIWCKRCIPTRFNGKTVTLIEMSAPFSIKIQCVLMLRSLYWPFLDTLNIGGVLKPTQTELSMHSSVLYRYPADVQVMCFSLSMCFKTCQPNSIQLGKRWW